MANRVSSGLQNALMGATLTRTATTLSFVSSTKRINDSGSGLALFLPGDYVLVSGASNGTNNGLKTVVTVDPNGSYITVAESLVDESAGSTVTIALLNGRNFVGIFRYSILGIFSGTQPASSDLVENGTPLVWVSQSSLTFTPGVATNGLNFAQAAGGKCYRGGGEVWSGIVIAEGTAGWYRHYTNLRHMGASSTAIRYDGACGRSDAELILTNLSLQAGATVTIESTYYAELPSS